MSIMSKYKCEEENMSCIEKKVTEIFLNSVQFCLRQSREEDEGRGGCHSVGAKFTSELMSDASPDKSDAGKNPVNIFFHHPYAVLNMS